MAKFALIILLIVGTSAALAVTAEVASSSTAAILNGCSCTCPVGKSVSLMQQTGPAAVVKSRKRRQANGASNMQTRSKRQFGLEFKPTVIYENKNTVDTSQKYEEGDSTRYSNNGGNTNIYQSTSSTMGNGNEGMHNSLGLIGGSTGNLYSGQDIIVGR